MPRDDVKANTYEESLAAVLAECRPLETETIPFRETVGRVLAAPLLALGDDPPAPKSAMDGFALRAEDTRGAAPGAPLRFAYREVVGAGHLPAAPLSPGGAVRIMTGALLPKGADAVVKLEDTARDGSWDGRTQSGAFAITAPLALGENVFGAGSRFAWGDPLVPAGEPISAQALGLIAGQGLAEIAVSRRPRVALLALGDELAEPGQAPRPGQIFVSNLYALEADARGHGAETRNLGIAGDDPAEIAARLHAHLTGAELSPADVVITLGGSHRGDFDFVGEVFGKLGARLNFQRTLINWGGSTLFATRSRDGGGVTLCFGLPGTPLASWLAFELLVRPALWKLAGRRELHRPLLRARLAEPVSRRAGRAHFLPVQLEFHAGDLTGNLPLARLLTEKPGPGIPTASLANGLLRYPEGMERLEAGAEISVLWLGA